MTAQSPLPRACGGCGFGEGTFAGASRNDEDAPIAAVPANAILPRGATQCSRPANGALVMGLVPGTCCGRPRFTTETASSGASAAHDALAIRSRYGQNFIRDKKIRGGEAMLTAEKCDGSGCLDSFRG